MDTHLNFRSWNELFQSPIVTCFEKTLQFFPAPSFGHVQYESCLVWEPLISIFFLKYLVISTHICIYKSTDADLQQSIDASQFAIFDDSIVFDPFKFQKYNGKNDLDCYEFQVCREDSFMSWNESENVLILFKINFSKISPVFTTLHLQRASYNLRQDYHLFSCI